MWPASALSRVVISTSMAEKESAEISRAWCSTSTKRDMCVPLKLCGRFTYMLKLAIVCCSPPERSLTRTGWRMSLMPTRSMAMRRVSARPCTSSTASLRRSRLATAMSMATFLSSGRPGKGGRSHSGGGAAGIQAARLRQPPALNGRDHGGRVEPGVGETLLSGAVLDEAVGEPQVQAWPVEAGRIEQLGHGAARTAGDGVFLERHQRHMLRHALAQQRLIQRLHEAHVDHRGIEPLGGEEGRGQHRAEGQQQQPGL